MCYTSAVTKPPTIRPPGSLKPPEAIVSDPEAETHFQTDLGMLRQIVSGLDRLEQRLVESPVPRASAKRGYFTPDEDDRVRQGLLVYRNYRLAAYEIIFRYRDYASLPEDRCQLRAFLLAFGAALVLYAKSLKIIEFAEHTPLLRAKLNEPDVKYDLEAGFFDDVLAGYSSRPNYRSIRQADAFWRRHRGGAAALTAEAGTDWAWLTDLIRHLRHVVRRRALKVLWLRLRYDWRAFWRTVLAPARQARHGIEKLLGERFADAHFTARHLHAFSEQAVTALRACLQPGDVLLSRAEGRLTAAIIPGFWTHASIFLGARSDLENLGVCSHPHAAKHWNEIPAETGPLGLVIEALFPCVRLNPLDKCLQADHVVALRPNLPPAEIGAALGEAFGHLGKPYDFEFDFTVSSRVVCTELVYRSYHHRGPITFSLTKRLGRFTLSGDDIVAVALDGLEKVESLGAAPFQPVALVLKRRDGQAHFASPDRVIPLLRRLRRGWRPARRARRDAGAYGS